MEPRMFMRVRAGDTSGQTMTNSGTGLTEGATTTHPLCPLHFLPSLLAGMLQLAFTQHLAHHFPPSLLKWTLLFGRWGVISHAARFHCQDELLQREN